MKLLAGAPLYGRLLALPTNTRLGWKGLPGTDTLAYYRNLSILAVISFMIQAPGLQSAEQNGIYFKYLKKSFNVNSK